VLKLIIKYGFLLISGMMFFQCSDSGNQKKNIVAEVNDKKLFASDLSEIIPSGIGENDSAVLAQEYVEKWIKQELIIQKANENLSAEQKNVDRELQEYRNSLIIYKYKNELMKQRMDTTVSMEQIEQFYNSKPENFNLSKHIIKAIFVKIPNEVSNPELLKNLIANTSDEGLNELTEYCLQYAKRFDIFIENWVDFETVRNNIPQQIEDTEQFLTGNNQIELNDSNYYYLVRVLDYKLKNDLAPLEFIENNIKNLILNQRKIEFLKEIEDNIYTEGIRKNRFKVYKQTTNKTGTK
jgi:hypothetical protein